VERREFVKSALVTAGMASGAAAFGAEPEGKALAETRQEFYQLRTYTLRTGPQLALTQGYFERALIPALTGWRWRRWVRSNWTSARKRQRTMC